MTAGGLLTTGSFAVSGTDATVAIWTPGIGTVILTATNTLPATVFTSFSNLQITSGITTTGVAIPSVTGTLSVNGGTSFSLGHNVGATAGPSGHCLNGARRVQLFQVQAH